MSKPLPAKIIHLTKGCVAVISTADFRRVNKFKWHAHQSAGSKKKVGAIYARATIKGKKTYLHRFIMDCPPDMETDHKNHCPLDCRRENLENVPAKVNKERRRSKSKKLDKVEIKP